MVRMADMFFFIFVIVGALFISVRVVESRRWR
jgi:hypothetical protein